MAEKMIEQSRNMRMKKEIDEQESSSASNDLRMPTPSTSHRDQFYRESIPWTVLEKLDSSEHSIFSLEAYSNVENQQDETQLRKRSTVRGNKRTRNVENWRKEKAKMLRNSGKSYTGRTGKTVAARKMGPPCKDTCPHSCSKKFAEEYRLQLFTNYWKMGSFQSQRDFLSACIEKLEMKYRRITAQEPRKPNCAFYLRDNNSSKIRVCKTFLINTLGISERAMRTVIGATVNGTRIEDKRGRCANRKRIDEEILTSVRNHIKSMSPVGSEYVGEDIKRQLSDGGLTIADLHRQYSLERSAINMQPANYDTYARILNNEFFSPKKDQRDQCETHKNAVNDDKEKPEDSYHLYNCFNYTAFDSQFENRFAYSGESSSQSRTTAEHLNASTAVQPFSREETDNTSFTEGRIKVELPSLTQTSRDHVGKERLEISSKFKDPLQNISYIPKQKKKIPVVDDEMKNFVKSYGIAISKGLEALPADVAIEFSSKVLKELNEKVLEVEFKQNRKSDNESVYSWCSVSNENEKPDDLGTELDVVIQGEMPVEKTNEDTAVQELTREESNIVSFTAETVGMAAPVSTQTSRGHDTNESQEISSKLKKPPENQPSTVQDNNMIPSANDEMKNFVKSYGLAISRGLETLPDDVTIGVALNILKELNEKVLEIKFKHSSRSGSDYCDKEMNDGEHEVLPKDKEKINVVFLDIPIKIEPEFSVDNDCNF